MNISNPTRLVKSFVFSGLALSVVGFSSGAQAQFANAGFDSGTAYTGAPNIFVAGTPAPWTATSFTPDCYDNSGADGWGITGIGPYNNMFGGMVAHSGHRFLGFGAGSTFNEAFQQIVSPLNGGQTYSVGAWIAAEDTGKAAAFGGPYFGRGEVWVYLNSAFIGKLTQNTTSLNWESRSFTFVAPTASTAVFEFVAMGDPNNPVPQSYIGIDDCSLNVVPEPTSMVILIGAGLSVLRARRKV